MAQNYSRVDRSDDYAAYDFAQTTLDRLPPRAVVLTDSWTASPLWYLQFVEGSAPATSSSRRSSPCTGEDIVAFTRRQMADGRPVYMAEGLRTPRGVLADDFTLQPVLLNGIEEMIVNTLPKPQYRDDLVATGSLYAVLDNAPDTVVAAVPAAAARDDAFEQGVTLAGFETADAGGAARRCRAAHVLLARRPSDRRRPQRRDALLRRGRRRAERARHPRLVAVARTRAGRRCRHRSGSRGRS